ncbi:CRISPR-associated protein Cse1 [Roseivivax sediminis]|uniref:CRISPR-associated protein, Cse1 family n=1 Tax=Roseivivax sediminis TaxID=936889 RepID=A0A1I2EGT3_9RHOB|nr:CRISPR-associated protein Cse1 [Roseivivax sediminis]SFE91651.1 CRISPR-associated protein, Cse1 family [Roseivivax sediminis]
MNHNLLRDPLIETDAGWHSLPTLLSAMRRGKVTRFPALRPHQRPAWHMFLVQLGVLALAKGGLRTIPEEEEAWRDALCGLTTAFEDEAPWHLVPESPDLPAFLQAADPGGLNWSDVATPDALDMLITSRNHDLKREIARSAAPQDWIFALVSLQTMEGFGGAGNYGIARMNGGSSSRALFARAPAANGGSVVDPCAWWRRDVAHLLAARDGVSGKALLWCEPWAESAMLDFDTLDPLFIEICRRIRLLETPEGIRAMRTTSKAPRIEARALKGNTGDPWAPVHIAEAKSLTLGDRDWTYGLVSDLLYGRGGKADWKIPELAKDLPADNDGPMLLIAEAFARGNSKTDGFKSRVIPIPKVVQRQVFGTKAVELANAQITVIDAVSSALAYALALIAADGDREKVDRAARARAYPARAALQREADALFFPALWDKLAVEGHEARMAAHLSFVRALAARAREEFAHARPSIPSTRIMRPRAEVRGEAALNAGMWKVFQEIGAKERADG